MKITTIGPVYPYRGGIAHYAAMLVRALEQAGHSVQMISFKRQYPSWLYPGETDKDPSGAPYTTPAEYILDPLYPWTWAEAVRKVRQFQPDLVITHWWTTFWALPFAWINARFKRAGLKTMYLIHNVLPHEQRPFDKILAKFALKKGDEFIAQTPVEIERLQKLIPGANASLCLLPLYTLFTGSVMPKAEARKASGLPETGTILLFFGIIRPYKGLGYLLQALGILRKTGITPHLVIAGEFWDSKAPYLEMIGQFELSDQITLLDHYLPNEEISTLFSAADCLVAPYLAGTQSGPASAALSRGMPIIITPQIAEGFGDEYSRLVRVVPSADAEALAQAIKDNLQTPVSTETAPQSIDDGWSRMIGIIESLGKA